MSLEYVQELQNKVAKNEVVKQLVTALAGEFNAAHNLLMQAAMVQGYQKIEIRRLLSSVHKTEHQHITQLIDRIMELGGNPDIRPIRWDNIAECDYQPITITDQREVLDIAYQSKICKTAFYSRLLQFLANKDRTSYDLIVRILEEEQTDLEKIKKAQDNLLTTDERNTMDSEDEIKTGEI